MEKKRIYFEILKSRAVYGTGEDTSEWGTNWEYNAYLVIDEENRWINSPFFLSGDLNLEHLANGIFNYWKAHRDLIKNLSVIPCTKDFNSSAKVGIHLNREYSRSNFQVGQISDEELRRFGTFILDLQRKEEKSGTLETIAQSG